MSRMPIERMQNALEQAKTVSEEDYAKVKAIANIVRPPRSIIHKTPDEAPDRQRLQCARL